MNNYIELGNLKTYKLSREFSRISWDIYNQLNYSLRKTMGDQFIRSIDSVGANIAEGYGRWHYLNRIRFYYNARGSLFETKHWVELMYEREIINQDTYDKLITLIDKIGKKLNKLINEIKNINQ